MMTDEKRKNARIGSHNLLNYTCLDGNNVEVQQGMGRTLDISEGGIRMETHVPVDPAHIVSFTMAVEDDLMEINGKVAHSEERGDGKFETGIHFTDLDGTKLQFLKQFIVLFREQETEA